MLVEARIAFVIGFGGSSLPTHYGQDDLSWVFRKARSKAKCLPILNTWILQARNEVQLGASLLGVVW